MIGFILGGLYNGGQERQLCNLSRSLMNDGHKVKVVVYNKKDYSEIAHKRMTEGGVECIFLSGSKLVRLLQLRSQLREMDVVHCFAFYMNFFTWLATCFTRVLAIGGLRGDIEQYRSSMGLMKCWLNVAPLRGGIISNSSVQGRRLEEEYGLLCPTIKVVRNGYLGVIEERQILVATDRVIKIITVGRLVDYKRYDLALQAVLGMTVDFELKIFGDGPERKTIEALITNLGLEGRVSLEGEVEDIEERIRESHIMLHLSESEGTSNVIMESIANGCPVVCADVGDNSFLVQDGVTGFIVTPGCVERASAQLTRLSMDSELLLRMSKSATEYAQNNFGMKTYRDNALKAYKDLGLN
ncbi:glycosyltransferase family 4 protein [Akkermansiaceae bacterium]|nr:glycosyltransferase family 4 protein [Akkermansiaceae bacterium]